MNTIPDKNQEYIKDLATRFLKLASDESINRNDCCHACILVLVGCGADADRVKGAMDTLYKFANSPGGSDGSEGMLN